MRHKGRNEMTADDFRKKSRRAMANKNTRPVKVGRFIVTTHAQNKMILRDIPNEAMIRNLCRKPEAKSPVKYDSIGRPSYNRHNTESTTSINPISKNVATIHALKEEDAKKYGIKRTHLKTETELRKEKRLASKNRKTAKKPSVSKARSGAKSSKAKVRPTGHPKTRTRR